MTRRVLLFLIVCLWLGCSGGGPVVPGLPRPSADIHDELVSLFQAYLRIDTTNPPGNELRAARFLKQVLDREGIESQIDDLGSGRANLRAVLRGDGRARPLVLLHHMDVVGADASHWRVPPFAGEVRGGEIYGRGAVDIKGKGAIDLGALIHFKRARRQLHRDLILLAVADEEADSLGTRRIVERRPELVRNAEFLLDEGTSVRLDAQGQPIAYLVSIAEKAPLWITVRFGGRSGHGAQPIHDSAVNRAIRAAARLLQRPPRPVLLPELRPWLKLRLRGQDLSRLPGYHGDLDVALKRPEFLGALTGIEEVAPMLSDTISVTGLRGSDKVNVIPNQADIRLDCRLLPGSNEKVFLEELRRTLGDKTAQIRVDDYTPALSSPTGTALWRALQRVAARRDPGVPVVPTVLVSSTDSSYYRRLGIQAYGFEPYAITEAVANLAHGNDERLGVRALRDGLERLIDLIKELDK